MTAPYLIADAHTHIFPSKIAEKAVASIGSFYHIPMCHRGSPEALLASGSRIGVRKYLVCSTATRPGQVTSINDFIHEACLAHPEFVGLATLHPDYEDIEGEIQRVKELGLHGIKLHPDFQQFNIDDPAAIHMYRLLARAGLPVLFHTGDNRYDYSAPTRLVRVAREIPELTCIAAHFGGYSRWQDCDLYKDCPNVWFDTSSSLFTLPAERAMELIEELGEDRFLFGTDFPMWDHEEELERFLRLPLTEAQRVKIFGGNFQRLFGVTL